MTWPRKRPEGVDRLTDGLYVEVDGVFWLGDGGGIEGARQTVHVDHLVVIVKLGGRLNLDQNFERIKEFPLSKTLFSDEQNPV